MELLPALGFSAEVIQQLQMAAEFRNQASRPLATQGPLDSALEVIKAFPAAILRHANLGIPFAITAQTLRDLERRMREYRQNHGIWGFDRFAWMQNHLSGSLFEIGRLQFMPSRWRDDFDAYQSPQTGEVWALAKEGLPCDAKTLHREGRTDSPVLTIREKTSTEIKGHPANPITGQISPAPLNLPGNSILAATGGDATLNVHIPSGPGFTPAACSQSLQEARRFFGQYFPHTPFKAICCRTWLLDPALREIMPADSNLLGLGRLFHLLTVPGGTHQQHLERIFGSGADWKTFTPKTRLQTAAKKFLNQGGKFHLTSGFLLWNDARLLETMKKPVENKENLPVNLFPHI